MADLLTPDPKRLVAIDRLELPPTIPTVTQSLGYSAALSPDQQTTSDVIAQVYRGTSVVRHSPLPVQASAAAGAAANSAAKVIVEQSQSNVTTYVPGQNVTFTPNASGGATAINAVVPSAGGSFLPKPNSGLYFQARAIVGNTSLQTIGDVSTNFQSGGTANLSSAGIPTSTSGVAVGLGLSVNPSFGGWFPDNGFNFWPGRNCIFQARVTADDLYGTASTHSVMWLCFTQGAPSNMRTVTPAGLGGGTTVGFLGGADTGSYPPNWTGYVNGSTVDTGVAIVAGNLYYMEMVCNDTANTTSFSVNGSTPVIVSGHNISGFAVQPLVSFANNDTLVTHGMSLEYFYGQQDF